MPLTGLSTEEIGKYEATLMRLVPSEATIGNTALLRQLGANDPSWTKDRYFAMRNRLIDRAQIAVRRFRALPDLLEAARLAQVEFSA